MDIDMNQGEIIKGAKYKSIRKSEAVPLRTVIKEVLLHLYCKGVIPKSLTQGLYDTFKLKEL